VKDYYFGGPWLKREIRREKGEGGGPSDTMFNTLIGEQASTRAEGTHISSWVVVVPGDYNKIYRK